MTRLLLLFLALLPLFLSSRSARAQAHDPPESSPILTITEHSYRFTFDEEHGTPLAEFVEVVQRLLGKALVFDAERSGDVRIRCVGALDVPKHRLWSTFQNVLRASGFVVVPYVGSGRAGAAGDGTETGFYAIRTESGGAGGVRPGALKSSARIVPPEELARLRDDAGLVLTTTFRLEHVPCQEAVNMLQSYFTDPLVESVRTITTSNSVVATGYAQTLAGIADLLAQVDVPPRSREHRLERVPLQYAVAHEVLPVVRDLAGLEGAESPRAGGAHLRSAEEAPRIEPDARTNALLVLAAPPDVERVRRIVAALDVPDRPRGPSARIAETRVHRLAHAPAEEVAVTLTRWAQQLHAAAPPLFVPDARTNSLLVTCSAEEWEALEGIVSRLDEPGGE